LVGLSRFEIRKRHSVSSDVHRDPMSRAFDDLTVMRGEKRLNVRIGMLWYRDEQTENALGSVSPHLIA
jgi:hypothetical protein